MPAINHPEQYRNFGHSRTKAIRAHCLECSGDNVAEVRKCPAKGCALWAYRMGYEVNEDGTARYSSYNQSPRGKTGAKIVSDDLDDELYPCEDADENDDEKHA